METKTEAKKGWFEITLTVGKYVAIIMYIIAMVIGAVYVYLRLTYDSPVSEFMTALTAASAVYFVIYTIILAIYGYSYYKDRKATSISS